MCHVQFSTFHPSSKALGQRLGAQKRRPGQGDTGMREALKKGWEHAKSEMPRPGPGGWCFFGGFRWFFDDFVGI